MKQCPVCSKLFDDDATHCDVDGEPLKQSGRPAVETLGELIRLKSPLEIELAVNLVLAISRAVEDAPARSAGFFNPDDIPLKNGSEVDVSRFKAEIQARATTPDKQMLDEAAPYLSPEAAQQQPTDGASDVYSLSAILYEMLTGRPPFTAPSAA